MTDTSTKILSDANAQFQHIQLAVGDIERALGNLRWSETFNIPDSKSQLEREALEIALRVFRGYQFTLEYPQMIWSSLFLTSFGLFEACLDAL